MLKQEVSTKRDLHWRGSRSVLEAGAVQVKRVSPDKELAMWM